MTSAPFRSLPVALALALVAGTAAAQSTPSVQLWGVADGAVRWANTKDAGHLFSVASGEYSSARWGIKAYEDLGGGQSVSVWLESFLNMDTGDTAPYGFQRRSTISFTDRTWGEIRLGRDYTPTHSNWSSFDPFGYVGMGSVQLLILSATGNTPATFAFGTNPNDIQRANNGVQYILPVNPWGIDGNLVRTAGEGGTAANDQHKGFGGHLGVTYGPWRVSGAVMNTRDTSAVAWFHDSALAGAYFSPGSFRVTAGVRRLSYTTAAQNNLLLSGQIFLGVNEIKLSWNRAQMHGHVRAVDITNDRTDQYAIGYVYNLSKRTRLYTTAAHMTNQGNAAFVVPSAPKATAGKQQSSNGIELGLNQDF